MPNSFRFYLSCLAFVLLAGVSLTTRAETFLFATAADATRAQPIVEMIRGLYQSLGHDIEVHYFPAKRSLIQAKNDERYDGELLRIAEAQSLLPNLIRVPEPLTEVSLFMLAHTLDHSLDDIASLSGYKLAAIRGIIFTDRALKDFDVAYINDFQQGIDLLSLKRVDLFMIPGFFTAGLSERFPDFHLLHSPYPPMQLYHYLHRRHIELIPALAEAIRKLKGKSRAVETP